MTFDIEGLSFAGQITLGIFLFAAIFWILEPVPIFATSMLVIFLQILLLSAQGPLAQLMGGMEPDHWRADYETADYTVFLNTLANPIIILFLGGFMLASGAVRYQLDRNLTRIILRPFGTRPVYIAMGLMLVTAFLSAFMSNTATTAMMMTVAIPIVGQMPEGDRFRTGLALCIPFAANIGGIATPIGTPPNAVIIGALAAQDIPIAFTDWMQLALPIVIVMLLFTWWLLMRLYPSTAREVKIDLSGAFQTSWKAIALYAVFAITVLLWVTETLHGISSTVVAFFPIAALPALRVIEKADIRNLPWEVLWLMAGGIALGVSMQNTGLAGWLIGLIAWDALGAIAILAVFGVVALALSNFISNTVAATLLIPLAISLGAPGVLGPEFNLEITAVMIAVSCSMAMILPISTPPNAIAVSTGMIATKDMAKSGIVIGFTGLVLALLLSRLLWPILL